MKTAPLNSTPPGRHRAWLWLVALTTLTLTTLALPLRGWAQAPSERCQVPALKPLIDQRVGQWQVRRVEVLRPEVVTVWMVRGDVAAPVRLLCREATAPQRPAIAHSARFDLRSDGRGATPEDLGVAIQALAERLPELEGAVRCATLRPSANRPIQPARASDKRWTVQLERATGVPLRDAALLWVSLWLLCWSVWVWSPRLGSPRLGTKRPTDSSPQTPRHKATPWLWVALIGVGLSLRAAMVGSFTLNPDEHASLDGAPWLEIFRGDDDSLYHPPLARAVFRGWAGVWQSLWGEQVPRWWWRTPSVMAGVAALLAWRGLLRGPWLALSAAALLALSPHGVFISDLAKPYAMTAAAFLWGLVALRRGSAPWAALCGALLCWLDYVAGLAWLLTCLLASFDRERRAAAWRAAVAGAAAAAPLLPLALTGVQYARLRDQSGWLAAAAGFPTAPGLPPSEGVAGRGFGELLAVATGVDVDLAWLVCVTTVLALLWRARHKDGGQARRWLIAAAAWFGLGWLVAQRVYLRPQNLAFALFAAQGLLALGGAEVWRLLRRVTPTPLRRPTVALFTALALFGVARAPQLSALYANQQQGSVADMNFGPDCHRAAALALAQPGDVLAQLDGDAHCLLVEISAGAPHQRFFDKAGHLPGGAPCHRAVGRRWCAGGGDAGEFLKQLRLSPAVVAVTNRHRPPNRPSGCEVIGETADFVLWRCRPAS